MYVCIFHLKVTQILTKRELHLTTLLTKKDGNCGFLLKKDNMDVQKVYRDVFAYNEILNFFYTKRGENENAN